jgi:hypothetical protein
MHGQHCSPRIADAALRDIALVTQKPGVLFDSGAARIHPVLTHLIDWGNDLLPTMNSARCECQSIHGISVASVLCSAHAF